MATRYIEILANHPPIAFNVDENNRTMWSINFRGLAAGLSDKWERELVKLIGDAGLGTFGTDLFVGAKAPIPTGNGPYTTVLNTGGGDLVETQDGQKYERLTAQVVVRAKDYDSGRARARAIRAALDGQRDVTVAA